jgi:hypothetical protein
VSVGTEHEIALRLGIDKRRKSAGLALLLSLIVPGAGQLYCGKSFRDGMTLCFSDAFQERTLSSDLSARRSLGRLRCIRGYGSLCGHYGGHVAEP